MRYYGSLVEIGSTLEIAPCEQAARKIACLRWLRKKGCTRCEMWTSARLAGNSKWGKAEISMGIRSYWAMKKSR